MIRSIEDFKADWAAISEGTLRALSALTDESLAREVSPGGRSLGRIAWHLAVSIPEMSRRTGLAVDGPAEDAPVPSRAAEILDAYRAAATSLAREVSRWDDATLLVEDDMYGESWARGRTLRVLLDHEIHHRGQMTILMRQADLPVPGVCGPSKEEWAAFGAPAPQ